MSTALRIAITLMCTVVLTAGAAGAQQGMPEMTPEQAAMMEAWQKAMTPGVEHEQMAKMVGEFTLTVKTWMEPGGQPEVSTGTAVRRMIMGGRYLEEVVHGEAMGQPFEGSGLMGYDNVTGQWWGTWVDTMSTGLMTSTGQWNEAEGVGIYIGESSDPMTGAKARSKTVVRRLEDGDEIMEMFMLTDAGEVKSMEIDYDRK